MDTVMSESQGPASIYNHVFFVKQVIQIPGMTLLPTANSSVETNDSFGDHPNDWLWSFATWELTGVVLLMKELLHEFICIGRCVIHIINSRYMLACPGPRL